MTPSVPKCPRCHKILIKCKCADNTLDKGKSDKD